MAGLDIHELYSRLNMSGRLETALAVIALSWHSLLFAGLGNALDEPANIAVANNSVVYLTSVTGNASLRIGCMPEDRMPSIPEPNRSQRPTAQPEPIMTLLGDWLGKAKDGLDARFEDLAAKPEIRVEFVLDENHRISSTWALHKVRTSEGGHSLAIREQAAIDLLKDAVANESLVIVINVFNEVVKIPFHLAGLEQALDRAITCLP